MKGRRCFLSLSVLDKNIINQSLSHYFYQNLKSDMHKRGGHRPREDDPIVKISKNLSYLLRHGAVKEGLNIDKDGFVLLSEILAMDFYKTKRVTEKEIREVVESNDKKRFELKTVGDKDGNPVLYIRASQGHSIQVLLEIKLWANLL